MVDKTDGVSRASDAYTLITMKDKTGTTTVSIFEDSPHWDTRLLAEVGSVVAFEGTVSMYKNRNTLSNVRLKVVNDLTPDILDRVQAASPKSDDELWGGIQGILTTVDEATRSHVNNALASVPRWRVASHYQSYTYRRGLMELTSDAALHAYMVTSSCMEHRSYAVAGVVLGGLGRAASFTDDWCTKLTDQALNIGIHGVLVTTLQAAGVPFDLIGVASTASPFFAGTQPAVPAPRTAAQVLAKHSVTLAHDLFMLSHQSGCQ